MSMTPAPRQDATSLQSLATARDALLARLGPIAPEVVALRDALGLALAERLTAPAQLPGSATALRDGVAAPARPREQEPGLAYREVAEREGCIAQLVADERSVDWAALENVRSVAVTAGASAPETLVERLVEALKARYDVTLETLTTTLESMAFPLPRDLREMA